MTPSLWTLITPKQAALVITFAIVVFLCLSWEADRHRDGTEDGEGDELD